MKTNVPSQRLPARRGRVLADGACPTCGTMMVERRGKLRLPVNGEEIVVPSAMHLSCSTCGEVVLRLQDSKRLGEDAIAIFRKKHRLLSADELRALRGRFKLTQADLARLLRLGANTVSRWESGRNVQTAAMDMRCALSAISREALTTFANALHNRWTLQLSATGWLMSLMVCCNALFAYSGHNRTSRG